MRLNTAKDITETVMSLQQFAMIRHHFRRWIGQHRLTLTLAHTHHTSSSSSSSDLLAPKGVGQGPGSSLGPVTKADRLSNGWAGQAHARQPWGEWLLGTLAVKMAVRRARWTAR